MGRGLSELQKFILKETAKRGILFRRDIRDRFFRWKSVEEKGRYSWLAPSHSEEYIDNRKQYASMSASIARALSRLKNRGLIEHRSTRLSGYHSYAWGVLLTDEGAKYAAEQFSIRVKRVKRPEKDWWIIEKVEFIG